MVDWNLGSFANEITNMVDNIPASLSGGSMHDIINRKIQYVEDWTGETIGSTSVILRFQPTIMHLALSDLAITLNTQGADVSQIRVGDFSLSKGAQSNLTIAAREWSNLGMMELNAIGKKIRFGKSLS